MRIPLEYISALECFILFFVFCFDLGTLCCLHGLSNNLELVGPLLSINEAANTGGYRKAWRRYKPTKGCGVGTSCCSLICFRFW